MQTPFDTPDFTRMYKGKVTYMISLFTCITLHVMSLIAYIIIVYIVILSHSSTLMTFIRIAHYYNYHMNL